MSHEEFTKLFQYVVSMDERINARLDSVENRLTEIDDGLTKLINDHYQEFIALGHKVDRHEKWHHKIAKKTGVKLEY